MVDLNKLKKAIDDSGVSMVKLAEKSGIPRETIYNRFNNIGEFTASEILGITKALRLTPKERESIFFIEKSE